MICKICNKEFKKLGSHLLYNHDISSKEYYDKYIRTENEGLCPECGKETIFKGVSLGYHKFCSVKCSRRNEQTQQKYKKTNIERYGVGNLGAFGACCIIIKYLKNMVLKIYLN